MHQLKRRVARYSRWLHIYVSMTSFVIVLFFAVTGWTLNHPDKFGGLERRRQATGSVDSRLTNTAGVEPAKQDIVQALQRDQHAGGALSDFRVDLNRTFELLADVPAGKTVVSESGIATTEQLAELERVGVDAVLIGTLLMRSADPETALRSLLGFSDSEPAL